MQDCAFHSLEPSSECLVELFLFQYPGRVSGVLSDHRVPLLFLDLRVPGRAGGAAGLEVQGADHHLCPLPRPLHRLSRGQPQHQVV